MDTNDMASVYFVKRDQRWRVAWNDADLDKRRTRTFRAEEEARHFLTTINDPAAARTRKPVKPLDERYQLTASGCWEWTAHRNNAGYGMVSIGGVPQGAHRVMYERHVGPIPDGLVIDHLCRNRACVNPAHLEPVTQRENLMRSPIALGRNNSQKTHCPKGHPYSPENTYIYDARPKRSMVQRICKTCRREYRARRRAAEAVES